jgi:hypothetical protein
MAAPANSQQEVMRASEIDGSDDIGGCGTAGNQCGAFVNHAIPDGTGSIIPGVAWAQERAPQLCLQFCYACFIKLRLSLGCGCRWFIHHRYFPFSKDMLKGDEL